MYPSIYCMYPSGAAQRVFLSTDTTTPLFGDTVELICYYPNEMEMVNGQPRYTTTTASYRVNGKRLFPDDDVFDQKPNNQTATRLRVRIDSANFTGDLVSFTCYLTLTAWWRRGQRHHYHRPTRYITITTHFHQFGTCREL